MEGSCTSLRNALLTEARVSLERVSLKQATFWHEPLAESHSISLERVASLSAWNSRTSAPLKFSLWNACLSRMSHWARFAIVCYPLLFMFYWLEIISYERFTYPYVLFNPGFLIFWHHPQPSVMVELAGIATATVSFILIVIDIVGNGLVCAIVKKNRNMRYAKT